MHHRILALTLSAVFCSAVHAQPVGLDFYSDLAALPFIYDNVQSYYLSSYDRTGGNDDGFRGTYSQLYIQDNGEHVIFDQDGEPGQCLRPGQRFDHRLPLLARKDLFRQVDHHFDRTWESE